MSTIESQTTPLRHLLAARGLIVLPGLEPAITALEQNLRTSLQPRGPLQEILFKCILEASWNLERCRHAIAHLYLPNQDGDPIASPQYALIQRYYRQAESSLHRNLRALGKIQTEEQFRYEAFPLTEEVRSNEELFAETPQALSDVCDFQKVVASATRRQKAEAQHLRNEANSDNQRLCDVIRAFGTVPKRSPEFQAEFDFHLGKDKKAVAA